MSVMVCMGSDTAEFSGSSLWDCTTPVELQQERAAGSSAWPAVLQLWSCLYTRTVLKPLGQGTCSPLIYTSGNLKWYQQSRGP